ncbi:hypothetical protein [Pseudoglutamicibacter albus]|uniref:hypothetical protein n=1 Tax=Pseudoglutamicibacter albus TaxID=98671 RepID=UPI000A89E6D3|nr:hypothetical protein [Pseudoglutamicibacter albus]
MNQQNTHTARTGNELPPRNAVVPLRNAAALGGIVTVDSAVIVRGIVTLDSAAFVGGAVILSPHQWSLLENASDMSG